MVDATSGSLTTTFARISAIRHTPYSCVITSKHFPCSSYLSNTPCAIKRRQNFPIFTEFSQPLTSLHIPTKLNAHTEPLDLCDVRENSSTTIDQECDSTRHNLDALKAPANSGKLIEWNDNSIEKAILCLASRHGVRGTSHQGRVYSHDTSGTYPVATRNVRWSSRTSFAHPVLGARIGTTTSNWRYKSQFH